MSRMHIRCFGSLIATECHRRRLAFHAKTRYDPLLGRGFLEWSESGVSCLDPGLKNVEVAGIRS